MSDASGLETLAARFHQCRRGCNSEETATFSSRRECLERPDERGLLKLPAGRGGSGRSGRLGVRDRGTSRRATRTSYRARRVEEAQWQPTD